METRPKKCGGRKREVSPAMWDIMPFSNLSDRHANQVRSHSYCDPPRRMPQTGTHAYTHRRSRTHTNIHTSICTQVRTTAAKTAITNAGTRFHSLVTVQAINVVRSTRACLTARRGYRNAAFSSQTLMTCPNARRLA